MTILVTLPSPPQLFSPDLTDAGGGHLPGNSDGSRGGPVGEAVAKAFEEGYEDKAKPFHGYYFKVLKDREPAAHRQGVQALYYPNLGTQLENLHLNKATPHPCRQRRAL